MKKFTVDHQNYHIFKTKSGAKTQSVHFQWGKFDFRMTFAGSGKATQRNAALGFSAADGSQFSVTKFEVLYQNEWFEFVKPTAHGMQLEETLWRRNERDYYVEFPKDLKSAAQEICAEELGLVQQEKVAA
ncbi:MAG: hypothetical protein H8E38_08980 [SAR324 cluster bacterium]|nr:hypothetical protein [SAR324 cluster bacterium]MBL7034300.1 hypothetical protein [SAR324 cluster bacterium]